MEVEEIVSCAKRNYEKDTRLFSEMALPQVSTNMQKPEKNRQKAAVKHSKTG